MEYNNYWEKISRFFKSRKLALFLIILIIFVSLLGSFIPQKHIYEHSHLQEMIDQSTLLYYLDKIGFTSIYTSWLFLGIMFLFYVNTAFCTYGMFKNAVRKVRKGTDFRNKRLISKLAINTNFILNDTAAGKAQENITSSLKGRRYKVKQEGSRIVAQKNRFGVFGTPVFHLCILLVLVAILYGGVGRMEGRMQLAEGQTLTDEHHDYLYVAEGPLFHEKHSGLDIHLEKFNPNYRDDKGIFRGAASEIIIMEDGVVVKKDRVHSNHLVYYRDMTFFQNEYGFAPLFLLKNESGAVISGSYVYAKDDESGRYLTVFPVADTGITAQVTLYPNTSINILQGSYEDYVVPQHPQVYLELFEGDERVFEGVLGMNQMVVLGNYGPKMETVTLGFYDLKYWSIISIVIDHGVPFIFAGFYLAVFSLFVMFFFSPRRIWVDMETDQKDRTVIFIGGRSDRYKSSFRDELNTLIKGIKEAVKDESN